MTPQEKTELESILGLSTAYVHIKINKKNVGLLKGALCKTWEILG